MNEEPKAIVSPIMHMVTEITANDSIASAEAVKTLLTKAIADHSTAADDLKARADEIQGDKENETMTREDTLRRLAAVSAEHWWTIKDIQEGAALAVKGSNNLPTSMKAFANEMVVAMSPGVRVHFADVMDAAINAWNQEAGMKALDKDIPTPVMKAFKRRYHTIVTCARRMLDDAPMILNTPDKITAYAVANDPDVDVKKAHKRLVAAMGELAEIARHFPEQDIKAAYDGLTKVSVATMTAARVAEHGEAVPTTVVGTNKMTAEEMKAADMAERQAERKAAEAKAESAATILNGAPTTNTTVAQGVVDLGGLGGFNGAAFSSGKTVAQMGVAA